MCTYIQPNQKPIKIKKSRVVFKLLFKVGLDDYQYESCRGHFRWKLGKTHQDIKLPPDLFFTETHNKTGKTIKVVEEGFFHCFVSEEQASKAKRGAWKTAHLIMCEIPAGTEIYEGRHLKCSREINDEPAILTRTLKPIRRIPVADDV